MKFLNLLHLRRLRRMGKQSSANVSKLVGTPELPIGNLVQFLAKTENGNCVKSFKN